MSTSSRTPSYVIVSPVKNEERHVELTLHSVLSQTQHPESWVIVDDGSTDRSVEIISDYVAQYPFISLVHHRVAESPAPGIKEVAAFNFGRSCIGAHAYDVIVKLDCDLSFNPDYFARLLAQFALDPDLGIASGIYLEQNSSGAWEPVPMPYYHAFGASKAVRRSCFEQIGGFVPEAGWDTVDEIRARCLGWNTTHFAELQVKHHKPEGKRIGVLRTSRMHGEAYYRSGGGLLAFMIKLLRRSLVKPLLLNAVALAGGYLEARWRRSPKLVTAFQARYYRRLLDLRIVGRELAPLLPTHKAQED